MQIFSLMGEILLKDSGVSSKLDEIDKKARSTSKSMGISFSSIAGAALKLGSIIGVSLGFKSMIDGAAASQQKLAQMDAVLKSTGGAAGMTKDELIKLADAQGKLTTFSKGANIESENLLLTFTGIGKKVFPDALKTVNDMSQALGQDTKSSAIQLGKALNDPIKGITALSRVGVNFTEQQKEQIKALQEAGKTEEAQKIILQELQKEFGGSAEAAGKTFTGQMTILKNQISGTASQLGGVLIPYLTDFITKINNHMPEIKQVITNAINAVAPIIKGLGDTLKFVMDNSDWLIPVLAGVVSGIAAFKVISVVSTLLTTLTSIIGGVSAAGGILNAVMAANPIGIVCIAIGALIAIGIILYNKSTIFRNFVNNMWTGIKDLFTHVLVPYFMGLVGIFTGIFGSIGNSISSVFKNIKNIFSNIIDFVKNVFTGNWKGAWQNIINIFSNYIQAVGTIWKAPLNAMIAGINGFLGGISKIKIPDWVPGLGGKGFSIPKIPMLARGTDYWQGGLAMINESNIGGEIVDLPKGSRVIPHDVSMSMAKNGGGLTLSITNFYNNRKEDIEELAQELEFYRRKVSIASGTN